MVSYASTNALSMLGGDDYTTLQEEIDDISGNSGALFVHKIGNLTESINGEKTFTSNFFLNVPTSVTANVGLFTKLSIDTTQTTIVNDYIVQDASFLNELSVASVLKSSIDATTTGTTNDYIREYANTEYRVDLLNVDKLNISPYVTTIYNDNIYTSGILSQSGQSTFTGDIIANADNITFNEFTSGLPRYQQPAGSTNITAYSTPTTPASIYLNVSDLYAVGPGTITHDGNSTFYGDFVSYGDNTTFQTSSAVVKYRQFPTTTEIMNDTITNVATTAFKVQGSAGTDIITTAANTTLTLNPTTTYTQKVAGTTKVSATTTTLALTSPATTIAGLTTTITGTGSLSQPGYINLTATDPYYVGGSSGQITLNAQTFLYLQAGTSDYIRVAPLQILNYVNGATKIDMQSTQTVNTNATINNVASTAFKVQNTLATDKLNIAPTLTKNTNATITEVATTAFQVQNVDGTNRLIISPTSYSLNSAAACPIFINAGTFLNVLSGTTMAWAVGDSMDVSVGSTYVQTSVTSSEYKVNGVQKLMMTTTLTTLTNTSVDVVAPLYATKYNVGTTASGRELLTFQLSAQRLISTQGISAGITYNMNFGNNSLALTSTRIGTPNIIAIPIRCCVFFDSGTITTGGVMTAVVKILTAAGVLVATSFSFFFTSASSSSLTSLVMTLNSTPARDEILQMTITISSTAAITASTKNVYAIVYCQQQ